MKVLHPRIGKKAPVMFEPMDVDGEEKGSRMELQQSGKTFEEMERRGE